MVSPVLVNPDPDAEEPQEGVEISFRPLHRKVLIQRCQSPLEQSGIVIPKAYREKSPECIVHAVGDEVREVRVGDHVLITGWEGQKVKIEGIDLLIIHEDGIKCVLQDDEMEGGCLCNVIPLGERPCSVCKDGIERGRNVASNVSVGIQEVKTLTPQQIAAMTPETRAEIEKATGLT